MKTKNSLKLKKQGFFRSNYGTAAIEAAFIIPIMMVVVFATIEFGFYFMQSYQVSRAASALAGFIQTYEPNRNSPGAAKDPGPADAAAMDGAIAGMAGNLAGSLPDKVGFCISAHASQLVAKNASLQNCGKDSRMFAAARYDVQAGHSAVPSQGTYYVPVVVSAPYKTVTGIESLAGFKMPTTLKSATVITINPATALSPDGGTCSLGQIVSFDQVNNKWKCNCPTGQIPTYDAAGTLTCRGNFLFGGTYSVECGGSGGGYGTFTQKNPVTGTYGCLPGYNDSVIFVDRRTQATNSCLHMCVYYPPNSTVANSCPYNSSYQNNCKMKIYDDKGNWNRDTAIFYLPPNFTSPYVVTNPLTGGFSCHAGCSVSTSAGQKVDTIKPYPYYDFSNGTLVQVTGYADVYCDVTQCNQ